MVSFRVSQDEFERLRKKSEAQGARSVSDYARFALCGGLNISDGQQRGAFHELSQGIEKLSLEMRRLFDLIENPTGTPNGHHAVSSKRNGAGDANSQ